MWRPGKLRFLIGVKNRFLSTDRDRQKTRPLTGPRRSPDSQLRLGYALPSSRIRLHSLILIDVRFSSSSPRSRPRTPEQLDEEELAEWRAGPMRSIKLAPLTIGARLAVA